MLEEYTNTEVRGEEKKSRRKKRRGRRGEGEENRRGGMKRWRTGEWGEEGAGKEKEEGGIRREGGGGGMGKGKEGGRRRKNNFPFPNQPSLKKIPHGSLLRTHIKNLITSSTCPKAHASSPFPTLQAVVDSVTYMACTCQVTI